MSRRHAKPSQSLQALHHTLRRPDLSILGNSVTSLPPAQWEDRMLFMGVPDSDLRHHTGGRFPATLRKQMDTHPVFVLRSRPSGHLVCPCTSKGDKRTTWYIKKGCRLERRGYVLEKDSFIVHSHAFTLPLDSRFSRRLFYKGIVPESCIRGGPG